MSDLPLTDLRRELLQAAFDGDLVENWAGTNALAWGRRLGYLAQATAEEAAPGTVRRHHITDRGRLALKVDAEHRAHFRVRVLGRSPIAGGGRFYGTHLRCACGVDFINNERPGEGGKQRVTKSHRAHVAGAFATAELEV